MAKFKVGDKFTFNLPLMKKNRRCVDTKDNKEYEVLRVENHKDFGEIITYEIWEYNGMPKAQCNAFWLNLVTPNPVINSDKATISPDRSLKVLTNNNF